MKIKNSLIKKLKKFNSLSDNIPTHYELNNKNDTTTLDKEIILNNLEAKVDIFLNRL